MAEQGVREPAVGAELLAGSFQGAAVELGSFPRIRTRGEPAGLALRRACRHDQGKPLLVVRVNPFTFLAIVSSGADSSLETTALLTTYEMIAALAKAEDVTYKPPGASLLRDH